MLQGTNRIKDRSTSGGTSQNGTHRAPPQPHTHRRSSGPSLTGGCVVRPAPAVLRPPPTPFRLTIHFPRSLVIGRHAPATPSAGCRAGEGLPSSRRHCLNVPRPHTPGSPSRLHLQVLRRFHGLRPDPEGLSTPSCHPHRRLSNDAAGFAPRYGPLTRSPYHRAFDTGPRRQAFPPDAASLLPGLLAATRTGLPPASDDELTSSDQSPTRSTSTLLGAPEWLSGRSGTRPSA